MSQIPKKPCAVCGIRLNSIDLVKHENECFQKIQSKHELYMTKKESASSSKSGNKVNDSQTKDESKETADDKRKSFIKSKQSNLSSPKFGSKVKAEIKDGQTPVKTITHDTKQSKTFGDELAKPDPSVKIIDIPMTPEKAQRQALLAEIRSDKSKHLKPIKSIDKEVKSNQSIKEFDKMVDQTGTERRVSEQYGDQTKNFKSDKSLEKKVKQEQSSKDIGKDNHEVRNDRKTNEPDSGEEHQNLSESKLSDKELLETTPYPKYSKDEAQFTVDDSELKGNLPGSEGYGNQLPELNAENEAAYQSHLKNLVPCSFCGRRFNPDRIMIHENACIEKPKKRKYITPDKDEKK